MNHPQPQQQPQQMDSQQMQLLAAQMEAELNATIERNKAGFAELQRRGINFDGGQVINARIDKLMESIAEVVGPAGQLWLLQARKNFEKLMEEQIANASREGTKAQLAQGGSFTPGMIRQLANETGTFGSSGLIRPV